MKNIIIDEIEIGHHYLTVWGYPINPLYDVADELLDRLPKDLVKIQLHSMRFHYPELFHPYGEAGSVGRTHFKHFHIIYDREPTADDAAMVAQMILDIVNKPLEIKITRVEDRIPEGVSKFEALQRSKEAYKEVMDDYFGS